MEREALKLALGFIEDVHIGEWQGSTERKEEVITAIKEALAQPEQEPVAWMKASDTEWSMSFFEEDGYVPLYTTPPQRTWVGLTAEEAAECWTTSATQTWKNFEAKLKEKNT